MEEKAKGKTGQKSPQNSAWKSFLVEIQNTKLCVALRAEPEGCVKYLKAELLVLLSQKCQGPCRDMTRGRGEEGMGEFPREWGCET